MSSHANSVSAAESCARDWKALWFMACAASLLLLGYLPVFELYARQHWQSDILQGAYQHAPLALLVSAWLAWRERGVLFSTEPVQGDLAGLALIGFGVVLKAYGAREGYDLLQGVSLVPVLAGLLVCGWGVSAWRRLRFPVMFLLFVIPLPDSAIDAATRPLLSVTAELSRQALPWFGLEVGGAGQALTIALPASETIHGIILAPECSGIRSLVALLALAALFGHLRGYRGFSLASMMALVVPLCILGNVLRVLVTAFAIVWIGPEAGQGRIHSVSGLLTFSLCLLGLILADRLVSRRTGGIAP